MEKLIHDAVEDLRNTVTCCICLGYYVRPVTLSCSHSYCEECIAPVLSAKKVCPICSSDIRRRNIVHDANLQRSIEEISAFVTAMETILPAPVAKPRSATLLSKPQSCTSPNQTAVTEPAVNDMVTTAPAIVTAQISSPEWPTFSIGDLVTVAQRTSAGMNKLGGVGRVTAVNGSGELARYSVKYVLDGTTEHCLEPCYISQHKELDPSSRRQRVTSHSYPASIERPAEPTSKRRRSEGSAADKENVAGTSSELSNRDNNRRPVAESFGHSAPRPIVMLSTALDPHLQSKLMQFAERCEGVTVVNSFSDTVTHIVVETDKRHILKHRTMKYLQGIITGKWIVSVQWVVDCLKQRSVLPEAPYEVEHNAKATLPGAPRRARLALGPQNAKGGEKLFSRAAVFLFGQFPQPGPAKSDIAFLLARGGATLLASPQELLDKLATTREGDLLPVVVVSSDESKTELTNSDDPVVMELRRHAALSVRPCSWVLDCVVNYSQQESGYPDAV